MNLETIRFEIIAYGKKLIKSGLTVGTGGHLRVCDRESGLMAITPSGIDYFLIQPELIVRIDVQTGYLLLG